MYKLKLLALAGALALIPGASVAAPKHLAPGEWDGVTASAHLDRPYEDPMQAKIPFGQVSYDLQPWRSYMDTWSAAQWEGFEGANFNADPKDAPALMQVLSEAGIRTLRIEIGWGNLSWNDELPGGYQLGMDPVFAACRKYGIRPMILLNANHGAPCPMRDVPVTLTQDAHSGDKILHLAPGTSIRVGYTGISDTQGIAAYPLVVKVDPDGTAHLSAALKQDIKAGNVNLRELKYQPFQGDHLADGTPVPACQETFDGWMKYVATVAKYVRFALGTTDAPDAGFDFEVWNEETFGSNFLNINNYYDTPPQYKIYKNNWGYVYQKTRPLLPTYRPDARTDFEEGNFNAILPMTVDFMQAHKAEYPGVKVVSGFSNQSPFDSGTSLWDGQAGLSRHYYTGGWIDISPTQAPNLKPDGSEWGTVDALGNFDGKHNNKDWGTIDPGSAFIPTVRIGYPEQRHGGFQTEHIARDLIPDSRWVYFDGHGRYTNNGDFHPAEIWQTEVNYYREPFFDQVIFKDGTISRDDPKALALDEHLAAKCMLRQYLFHNHKGLKRIYLFAVGADPYSFGMFPKRFYDALDASYGKLTPDARRDIPEGFAGLTWITKQMDGADKIAAPRPLKVADLIEYKPRLVWAGDGTPAHPDEWNRDWFTFLPYQLSSSRYLIPYYVQTVDLSHVWDDTKPLLDPARYDMPAQDFDVTVNNVRGLGAHVSVLDSITMQAVPVRIVSASANTVTLRLSAVDYPRLLSIDESEPGPSILDPKVLLAGNRVHVSWRTNIPASVVVTYGSDWENRSAHEVDLPAGTRSYVLPASMKGVVAVRIKVSANGLTDIWPRWDEDPQGQIVAPGGTISSTAQQTQTAAQPGKRVAPTEPIASLIHGQSPALPLRYGSPDGAWSVYLPAASAPQPIDDGMEAAIPTSYGDVRLRVRHILKGAQGAEQNLPFTSTIDSKSEAQVTLASGKAGELYSIALDPVAHPGELNLRQIYLFLPTGSNGEDLIVLSASGKSQAMDSIRNTVLAIAASLVAQN